MAQMESVLESTMNAAAGNAAAVAAKTLTTVKVAVAAAVMAGAVGLGGGYELGRTAQAPAKTVAEPQEMGSEHLPPAPAPAPATPAAHGAPAIAPAPEAAPDDVCAAAETIAPNKCSAKAGSSVTFAMKTRCSSSSVDVFWVDESCREVFRGIVAPGATFWQDSWEGHVFRVRDHATHRLVRELSPMRVEGALDRETHWKGTRTEPPLVVVHEGDAPIPESAVPECTRGGGRAAMLRVRNERKTEPVALMRVDFDCKETGKPQMIAPGTTAEVGCSEGHAFRLRDSAGVLLQDVVPTFLDTNTYVTVP